MQPPLSYLLNKNSQVRGKKESERANLHLGVAYPQKAQLRVERKPRVHRKRIVNLNSKMNQRKMRKHMMRMLKITVWRGQNMRNLNLLKHEEKASECKESDKDKRKKKQGPAKSSAKKGTAEKAKTKKVTISKEASLPPKKEPSKCPSSLPKKNKDTSTKKSSGKKKDESTKEKISTPKKASSIVSPGENILKVKDYLKEEKLKPSDD